MKIRNELSYFEKITDVFLALLFTLYLFSIQNYMNVQAVKWTFFCVICGGYCVVITLLMAESVIIGNLKLKTLLDRLRPRAVHWCLIIFFGCTVISGLLTKYRSAAWFGLNRKEGIFTIAVYVLTFYFVSDFACPKKWWGHVLGVSVSLFDILCVIQLCGANPFWLYPNGLSYFDAFKEYSGAYLGTIGNVDLTASFLCIVFPIFWILLVCRKDKKKYFYCIPLVLTLIVLIKMFVLAAIVGTLAATLIALPIVFDFSKKNMIIYLGCVFGISIAAIISLFFFNVGNGLLHELHCLLNGQIKDTFGSGRIYIWKNLLPEVPKHIWFGSGPDTISLYAIEPFSRVDESKRIIISSTVDTAHNEYLQILCCQGIIALVAYVGLLALSFRRWFIQRNNTVVLACGGAIACYAVQAFFGISQFISAPFFWSVLGILYSQVNEKEI